VALVFTTYLSYRQNQLDGPHTIQSWTCFFYNTANSFNANMSLFQIPDPTAHAVSAPMGFGRTCHESQASWGLLIGLVALEMLGVGVVAWGWWVERGIGKDRALSRRGEKGEKGMISRMSW